jgi:Tol biopolymer transport system component
VERWARSAAGRLLTLAAGVALVVLLVSPADATYAGKNGRIAFFADRGHGFRIYTMRRDGSDVRRVSDADAGSAVQPDWSPDGTMIVFGVIPPSEDTPCTTKIMRADGTGVHRVAGSIEGQRCYGNAAFTPSGHRLLVNLRQEKIRSMDLHGHNRRTILDVTPLCANTKHPDCTLDARPQVSPDGRTVLFEVSKHLKRGNRKALYTVRLNGDQVRRIVPFSLDVCACGGDWAPNGGRIVFSDHAGDGVGPQTEPTNLATVRPDGTGLRYLTHFHRTDIYLSRGSFSPDGRWVLYKLIRGGHVTLWKIHPNGTNAARIARTKFDFGGRDWGARPI